MQVGTEQTSSSYVRPDLKEESVEAIVEEFGLKFQIPDSNGDGKAKESPAEEEVGEEEDFSFAVVSGGESPVSADDVFQDGQIKPVFPLFDRSLLFAGDSVPSRDDLPRRMAVKKVFVEAGDSSRPPLLLEGAGQHSARSGKAVEASSEVCKKSNSTGFSKLWRFRDLLSRSNSDGRDAYVFLNYPTTVSFKKDEKVEKSESSSGKKTAGEAKGNNSAGAKAKAKKGGKGESASLSAHELHYTKNRASKGEDRRRSYLPYRPQILGFFTNVHGGLSRNVHPF